MALRQFYNRFLGSHSTDSLILAGLAVFITIIALLHYALRVATFTRPKTAPNGLKIPPIVPYFLPLLGNLSWQYFWDPVKLLSTSKYYARTPHPLRLRLLTTPLHLILGPQNILSLLGHTSTANRTFKDLFLRSALRMSPGAISRFASPTERVPPYHKPKNSLVNPPLYAWSSVYIQDFMSGRSAADLSRRFESNLFARVATRRQFMTAEGFVVGDFLDFFVEEVLGAFLEALCGRGLLGMNPRFLGDFWTFCSSVPTFMKGVPRWWDREAYRAQEEVIEAVGRWQEWAWQNSGGDGVGGQFGFGGEEKSDGGDAFWGSRFFRERYEWFVRELGFSPRDNASMETGFLFGATTNVTYATYWTALEVYKDPDLLSVIRKEVHSCREDSENGDLSFNMARLLQQPHLQAVWAECLRLRCHNLFTREAIDDLSIGDWLIPKNKLVAAWSTPGHTDPKIWCGGSNSTAPPVHIFWPGRFLKPTEDGKSVRFSLAGSEGYWLPFGSGAYNCPGRHFAKVHSMLTVAMMVETFDIDIAAGSESLGIDMKKYGMGVLGPNKKVAARIKDRRHSVK